MTNYTQTENQLRSLALKSNYSGFLPNESLLENSLAADRQAILSSLPFSLEQFNADLARRGIYSAGEASKYQYASVINPLAAQFAATAANARLGFAQFRTSTQLQIEGLRQSAATSYLNYGLRLQELEEQRKAREAQLWGQLFSVGGAFAATLINPVAGAATVAGQRAV